MSILAAFMVPHPPMIVPEVGKGSEAQITETTEAYERVADEVAALKPDTMIITSPHSVMYADYFHISPGSGAAGSFSRFRAPGVVFSEQYDTELVKSICGLADGEGHNAPAGSYASYRNSRICFSSVTSGNETALPIFVLYTTVWSPRTTY